MSSLWRRWGCALCGPVFGVIESGPAGSAGKPPQPATQGQSITRAGEQASRVGQGETFTGRVRIDPVWPASEGISASGSMVTFEPGARSAWHTHPAGQRLVVMTGMGLTQEWGKPVQLLRPGDVVWCPPGVKHWHGATPTTALSHLAVTGSVNGRGVDWLEHVSDDQYGSA